MQSNDAAIPAIRVGKAKQSKRPRSPTSETAGQQQVTPTTATASGSSAPAPKKNYNQKLCRCAGCLAKSNGEGVLINWQTWAKHIVHPAIVVPQASMVGTSAAALLLPPQLDLARSNEEGHFDIVSGGLAFSEGMADMPDIQNPESGAAETKLVENELEADSAQGDAKEEEEQEQEQEQEEMEGEAEMRALVEQLVQEFDEGQDAAAARRVGRDLSAEAISSA